MFDEFLNGELSIYLTKRDIKRLSELQEVLGDIRWASHHKIDSELTRRYINRENIYIYTASRVTENEKAIYFYGDITAVPVDVAVPINITTLDEFLESDSGFDVLEDDLMKLL